jgi:hypothetical protein
MLRLAALCLLALGALAAPAHGATLVGDYRFDNRLAASDGSGAPLTNVGPGASSFATENVGGHNQTVLRFPRGNGVRFTTTAPLADYSVVVQFRLEEVSGWRRIMDMSSRAGDRGLYFLDGQLQFFPSPVGPSRTAPNQWVEVAMTRTGSGVVNWYVNGAFEATRSDTTAPYYARLTDSVNFFVDDLQVPGEMAGGAVARVRVFDGVLGANEVEDLPSGPIDADGDGVVDGSDNCPSHPNAEQADLDADGAGDECDEDIDGDGVGNGHDAFPRDASESADSDGDGVGDNADAFPSDPTETADTDGDGVGDSADNAPRDPNPDQQDVDEDGIGDVIDPAVLPLSADMCRRDGWKRFHADGARFRNQGDCISFVATRGKNLPAG